MTGTTIQPRFDWYSATVLDSYSSVLDALVRDLRVDEVERGPGMRGFDSSRVLRARGVTVARVFMSSRETVQPHVVGSSVAAADLARVLKGWEVTHRVARADSCVDFTGPSEYERLESLLLETAESHRLKLLAVGNIWSKSDGRPTVYVGSPSSETRVRLYDKHAESGGEYEPDTYRLELQTRPAKPERKVWVSNVDAAQVWGLARWSNDLGHRVGIDGEAAPPRSKRRGDLDSALDAAAAQYGRRFLESLRTHEGDVEAFALDLLGRIPASQANRVSERLSG